MMALKNRTQAGFSMIELMTGIAIGLFLLTGITGVFVANQITAQTKRNLDEIHESLRFVNMTLSRVIRQASGIDPSSTSSELRVNFSSVPPASPPVPSDPPALRDCIGAAQSGPNRFYVENGQLMCEASNPSPSVSHLLAPGIAAVTFAYGADTNNDGRLSAAEYVATPANWGDVRSVRVTLRFSEIRQESFVVTLREKMLEALNPS
jgi:type IV pilus assembly protein PilW